MAKLFLFLYLISFHLCAYSLAEPHFNLPIDSTQKSNDQNISIKYKNTKATGNGVISGTLIDIETNELVSDDYSASISLVRRENSTLPWQFESNIPITGSSYQFADLQDGEYYLSIRSQFFLDQEQVPIYMPTLWHPQGQIINSDAEITSDNILVVNAENTVINADFKLVPAAVLVVTNSGNNGINLSLFKALNLENVFYQSIYSEQSNVVGNQSITTRFLFNYLPVGDYRLYVNSSNTDYDIPESANVNEIFGQGECYSCELELLAGEGESIHLSKFEKKTIDINPSKGASIAGEMLFEENENDVAFYSWMVLTSAVGTSERYAFVLDENSKFGEYNISGLAAGEYYTRFSRTGYMRKSYGEIPCPFLACEYYNSRPIRLVKGENKLNINNFLRDGTSLFGSILDAETGEALEFDETFVNNNFIIEVLDENLNTVSGSESPFFGDSSLYNLRNTLPNGKYYIKTGSSTTNKSNRNYVNQVYPNIECEGNLCDFSQAELIEINSLSTIEDINFSLNRAHSLSGQVKNLSEGTGLKGIDVVVLNKQGLFVDVVKTNSNGEYKLRGLKSGDYYVRTYNGNKKHFFYDYRKPNVPYSWVNKIYPGLKCSNNLCPLDVSNLIHIDSQNMTGIDFELEKGFSVSGFVKNKVKGIGIADIEIKLYSESNEYIESYYSDEEGYYRTAALEPSSYKLVTENPRHYVNQSYGGIDCGLGECDVAQSDTIAIVDNSVEDVNFDLISGQDYYPQLSGLWYNSNQSGHGLQLEVIQSNGTATLFVSWYVVKDGEPMWLTGTGPLNKELAFIDLYITKGNAFPPNFDPNSVQNLFWGTLNFKFTNINNATMNWKTDYEGFSNGSLNLTRLTNLSVLQKGDGSIDACLSGTYFNPDQNGHGVMIEVLGETANSMVLTWFTYHDNKQFWILATGSIDGTQAHLSAVYTSGSNFPPNFNSTQIQTNDWGNLTLSIQDKDHIEVNWQPNSQHIDFGSGSIELQRLTKVEAIGCE